MTWRLASSLPQLLQADSSESCSLPSPILHRLSSVGKTTLPVPDAKGFCEEAQCIPVG